MGDMMIMNKESLPMGKDCRRATDFDNSRVIGKITEGPQLPALETASNAELLAALNNVTMLLRVTNERMAGLEAEVKRLTKVTPSQAAALNKAIRDRAKVICEKHRAAGCEKAMASAIRAAVKNTCGISTARELPRCDYPVAMRQVEIWDDFRKIREIKAKEAARNG